MDQTMVELLREMDQRYQERLAHLEVRIDNLDERIHRELSEMETCLENDRREQRASFDNMAHDVRKILDQQTRNEPILLTMDRLIVASSAMRWLIIAAIGSLAAVSTIASAVDIIKKWFHF